ncbi:MAG: hypothetical protein U9N43_08830 [Euryarchaeota archaeon]|nr:hypothetical protein [Euryarchaeota archaeon]
MKINTLVGITMGLLLLALPVAASDYTLGVFERKRRRHDKHAGCDLLSSYSSNTGTRLELADAKHDSEIDIVDVTQIALIILGREKELTILNSKGEVKTIAL